MPPLVGQQLEAHVPADALVETEEDATETGQRGASRHVPQRLLGVRQRQEVAEMDPTARAPAQVVGDEARPLEARRDAERGELVDYDLEASIARIKARAADE